MNIAYICREFGPVTGGGIGTYIYNACMAMAGRGHHVFLLTDCFNDGNIHLLPKGVELIKAIETPPHRKGSFTSVSHEYSYRVYETLKSLVSKRQIDVAEFAEFGVEGFASIRAKRLLGEFRDTKLIVKLHTPSSLLYDINEDRRLSIDCLCSYSMEDYCVRYADMVTSPSLSLGEYFKNRVGRADIKKCPYPMELPEKSKPRVFSPEQIKRVRLIGSVQVRKGIDTFIKAAIQVLEDDPEFVFEIWGADRGGLLFGRSYTEIVSKLIPEQFKEKIIFCGSVPYKEIPELFKDSCFCVYPSRWENWANVCLEAMSYGCVVLASREGGMSEMIEHGTSGFVIDPLDPSDISRIIIQNSKKPDKLVRISERAQQRSTFICDPERAASQIEYNYIESFEKKEWKTLEFFESKAPLVSVVVPYFNQPQYLQETIESIKKSNYPAIEIIVVNDGSTSEEARSVFESLEGVTKLHKENGGLSSARNYGISGATGEFILPLDSDDLLEPHYLRLGVEALINNPELGYVSCHAQNFGEVTNAYIPVGYVPELMPYANTHGKCCNLYRKKVFDQCGGYDEVMTSYEDWDYLLTLEEGGIEGDVLPGEMFRYRRHFDSMVYCTANSQRADLIQYMMTKHEKLLQPHAGKMAIMLARLWKESELMQEFADQQLVNAYFSPRDIRKAGHGNRTRLQIYSAVDGRWSEYHSVYLDYSQEEWVRVKVNLPFIGENQKLRVDPCNVPGKVFIKQLIIKDRKFGRIVFNASGGNNFQGLTCSEQVKCEMAAGLLCLTAPDNDPQILLDRQFKKTNLQLEMTVYYSSDLLTEPESAIAKYRKGRFKRSIKGYLKNILGVT